jgi:hypothetical protein
MMATWQDRMNKLIEYASTPEPQGEHYFYEELHELILDAADAAPTGELQERVFHVEEDRDSIEEIVAELKNILLESTPHPD